MGRHGDGDGPRTSPLGVLVARDHGRHGDIGVDALAEDLDETGRMIRPRRWPGVALYLVTAALAGGTGWMFGHGPTPAVSRAEPVVWHVTATPSPTPAPAVTRTVVSPVTRWRTRTAAPPPPRVVTSTRWMTRTVAPPPAPTVTRWRTKTVAPPPPEGEDPNDPVHGGQPGR